MKLVSIQYLRVLAALMVVVTHIVLHPMEVLDLHWQRFGSLAVLIFFTVSGFIMVHTTGKGRFNPRDFLRRRVERVVPLYWLVTLAVCALTLFAPTLFHNTSFALDKLVKSLLFIPYMREDGDLVPLMKLGWSLNYEMLFYVIFTCTFRLTSTTRVLVLTALFGGLVVLGALFSFTSAIPLFYTQPAQLAFCAGMIIGWLYLHHGSARLFNPRIWPLPFIACGLIGFFWPSARPISLTTDIWFTLSAASLALWGLSAEARLPVSRIGLFWADATYSLYLTHMFAVGATLVLVEKLLGAPNTAINLVLGISGALALAYLCHKLVERPMEQRFKHLRHLRRTAMVPALT